MHDESRTDTRDDTEALTARQAMVLRTVVGAFVGEGGPIGSPTLARLLPEPLCSASIRNTLAELTRTGLVRKPHRSAGSVPTERGLRSAAARRPRAS